MQLVHVNALPQTIACPMHTNTSLHTAGQHERTVKIPAERTEQTLQADAHTTMYVKVRTTNKMGASVWSDEVQVHESLVQVSL